MHQPITLWVGPRKTLVTLRFGLSVGLWGKGNLGGSQIGTKPLEVTVEAKCTLCAGEREADHCPALKAPYCGTEKCFIC